MRNIEIKHTLHEYERSRTNKEVFRCIHPDCTHYSRREFLEGKRAICYKCKNSMILSWDQLKNKHPVCEFCSKSKNSEALRIARDETFKAFNELIKENTEMIDEREIEDPNEFNEKLNERME